MQLSVGVVSCEINLGSKTETLSTSTVADELWHSIEVNRTGLDVTISIDGSTTYSKDLDGPHLTLEYSLDEIFIAGGPGMDTMGYDGCLQDIRFNLQPLPVSGANDFASVVFVGGTPELECRVGPCYPNPCNTGNCSEQEDNTYLCMCPDGQIQPTSCVSSKLPLSVLIAFALLVSIFFSNMLVCVAIVLRKTKRRPKQDLNIELSPTSVARYEIHSNVYSYDDEGGGEEDTSMKDEPVAKVSVPPLNSDPTYITTPSASVTSMDSLKVVQQGHGTSDSPVYPRADSPDIDAFIEDRVNAANKEAKDTDSIKQFHDEGLGSLSGSLSTIHSDLDSEPYTIMRLKQAGDEFQAIADLLEPVIGGDSESDSDSSYETHNV